MKRVRSRKGAPGIVEVAARASVSPATVSRFFNDPEKLREPTRVKIKQAAEDLGYIRDRMAGSMHNRFSGTIGLVVPTIDNAIFSELIEAFSAQLQVHDRTMLIASHGYDLSKEVGIVRSLLERRIDGIALIGLDHDSVPLNMLEQRRIPLLSIWNYRKDSAIPCVGADNYEAGYIASKHLCDLGHKDISFLFPDFTNNDRARDRLDGAFDAYTSINDERPSKRLIHCPYDIGEAKTIAIELLQKQRPTAIVCGNDIISHGVLYACQASNISVPSEISIIGIGDFRGSAYMEPSISTVRLPARRIGILAAESLVQMSESGVMPNPKNLKVELTLMNRGSTMRKQSNLRKSVL